MSLKIKIGLIMSALVVLVLLVFSCIIYFSQRRIIYEQERLRQATIAESLAQVAEESILSGDDFSLINYTFKLKRNYALAGAYVFDGEKYLSHTDKELVRRRPAGQLNAPDDNAISKEITVGGRKYLVRTVFSEKAAMAGIQTALNRIFTEILRASLLVFLVGLAAAYYFASSLASPIVKLSLAAREVGKGNFSIEIKTSSGGTGDELETLKKEFNAMAARLRELDEMKRDFAASVTHELKSPLSAVESYAELLGTEFGRAYETADAGIKPAIERWAADIAYLRQNTRRLFEFINDLLDTAKIERGAFDIKKGEVEMSELIAAAIRLFALQSEHSGVELKLERPPIPFPALAADGERIKQVLSNLISNALKYTPAGGRITVSVETVDGLRLASLSEKIRVSDTGANYALVRVEDTGAGIPARDLERIFGKFEQLKASRCPVKGSKGVGLGLYIAKNIIEAHGGYIWAESAEGKGSRFCFALPA